MPENEFCRNCNRPLPYRAKPDDATPRWYKAGSGWACSEYCCERVMSATMRVRGMVNGTTNACQTTAKRFLPLSHAPRGTGAGTDAA